MSKRLVRWNTECSDKVWNQKMSKIPLSLYYVGHLLLDMSPALQYGLHAQGDSEGENYIFIFWIAFSLGMEACAHCQVEN